VAKGCTAPVVPAKDWRIESIFGNYGFKSYTYLHLI